MDLDSGRVPARLGLLLERALRAVAEDLGAVGLVVNGSVGSGTADAHSDLDLVVVSDDAADDRELARRAWTFVSRLGDVLVAFTGEHVGAPNLVIALVDEPAVHVDVKYARLADDAHRVEDGVVVWERDGAVTRGRAGTVATWPAPDPQWIEDRVWVWIHYAGAKAARGELFECVDALALLRSAVLGPLVARERGAPARGVRHLERSAPDRREPLSATLAGGDGLECLDALVATADLYRQLRPAGLQVHDRAERVVRDYVEQVRVALVAARSGELG